ncbi:alpha/beta hydrolase [Ruminococcaceae bacterium OttesenSCG-928-O06]|nr:alpha/beta hydrolase [Ruminococcaceae bacterium OttesenSCG-928-O06]
MYQYTWQTEYTLIGGIKQYLLHMPISTGAPVLLYLHGGPGVPESNLAFHYAPYWGNLFTVVHWDQRDAGKTLTANPPSEDTIFSIELFLDDLDAVVQHLKIHYCVEKIVLLGHSFGSILGSLYALACPENVQLYIGVGQHICMTQNDRFAIQRLREAILAAHHPRDSIRLKAIFSAMSATPGPLPLASSKRAALHHLLRKYGLNLSLSPRLICSFIKNPTFTLSDLRPLLRRRRPYDASLVEMLFTFDLQTHSPQYNLPLCYIQGENDYQTATPLVRKYFNTVLAPRKQFHLIRDAGHNTMFDQPEQFAQALAQARSMIEA